MGRLTEDEITTPVMVYLIARYIVAVAAVYVYKGRLVCVSVVAL